MHDDEIKSIAIIKRNLKQHPEIDQEWTETVETLHAWGKKNRHNNVDAAFLLIRKGLSVTNVDTLLDKFEAWLINELDRFPARCEPDDVIARGQVREVLAKLRKIKSEGGDHVAH